MESPVLKRAKPSVIVTALAILGLMTTLLAAHWQFNRAAYKEDLLREYRSKQTGVLFNLNEDRIEGRTDTRYARVIVVGQFMPTEAFFLDNKVRNGVAGYELIVPFKFAYSDPQKKRNLTVLVNRGWKAWGVKRHPHQPIFEYNNSVYVSGIIDFDDKNVFRLGDFDINGKLWPYLSIEETENYLGVDLENIIIHEEPTKRGLSSSFRPPDFGISTHKMYMGQWLIFATLIVFLYFYYGFWRKG